MRCSYLYAWCSGRADTSTRFWQIHLNNKMDFFRSFSFRYAYVRNATERERDEAGRNTFSLRKKPKKREKNLDAIIISDVCVIFSLLSCCFFLIS